MPALLKQWFDTVLTYGFAFGSTNQLQNKTIMVSVTAGAQKSTFAEDELEGIFVAIKSTAKYCGLIYQAPIISFGINFKPNGTAIENASALQSVQAHAQDLKSFIINYKHLKTINL
jgi:putative NADPH-quinone reductase